MDEFESISKYIDLLKDRLGLDIIIYDECHLLSSTRLANLISLGKWHTNPYCTRIKENKRLHSRCVYLKRDFVSKILRGNGVVKSTCFCGVAEYAMPIKYKGQLLCIVSAAGFHGDLKDSIYKILCKSTGLTYEEFMTFRERSLKKIDHEQSIIHAIEILSHLLKRFILEETDVLMKLDTLHCNHNAHVLKASEYIAQNFSKPIKPEAIAKHCHISESHLQHLFHHVTGHGIAEEIRICRLHYAEKLLCSTEYSIRYISLISGFSSEDYFSTVFKKHFKMSPAKYRKYKKNYLSLQSGASRC